jgi:hypothetical protein
MDIFLRTPFATSLGLLAVVMTAGTMGCAAIIGADDYQVGAAEGTAGSGVGQGGSQVGAGGSVGLSGSNAGGTRLGSGGSRYSDASASDVFVVKPESSVTPPKSDAKSDVVVPDTGTGGKPVGSGETLCTTSCAGAGLTCQHTALGPSGLCTYLCNDVSECDTTHDCIGSSDATSRFNYACVKRCPTNVCPASMTCVPLPTGPVCLPTDWLPHDLGLGDDCLQDEQCTSHQCVNKPNGWCSRPCQSLDLCSHDATDDMNYYGEYNWCINVLGGYKCTPGCSRDSADCANYPGTTCKMVTDIDGFDPYVCAF